MYLRTTVFILLRGRRLAKFSQTSFLQPFLLAEPTSQEAKKILATFSSWRSVVSAFVFPYLRRKYICHITEVINGDSFLFLLVNLKETKTLIWFLGIDPHTLGKPHFSKEKKCRFCLRKITSLPLFSFFRWPWRWGMRWLLHQLKLFIAKSSELKVS